MKTGTKNLADFISYPGWFFVIILLILISTPASAFSQQPPEPPAKEKELKIHGHTRLDPYYWMNERENPELISYLEAENEYTNQVLAPTEKLQEELFQEMKNRIPQDDQSAPYFYNGYFYYTRFEKGKEYPIYCRRAESMMAPEQIMLDVNKLAEPHPYFNVGNIDVSPDTRMLVFTVDTVGRRQYTIMLKNLDSGEITETGITNAGGEVAWASDNRTFFFVSIHPESLRYEKVFRYNYIDNQLPQQVYYEPDNTFYYMSVFRSKDDQYLMITSRSTLSNETRILPADQPDEDFKVFQERTQGLLYYVHPHKDDFYVLTNDNATNFRLMKTGQNTGISEWEQVVAHRDDVLLEQLEVFDDYIVLQERSKALAHLRIMEVNSDEEHYIKFPEEAYTINIGANARMDTQWLRFHYSSLTTPGSAFDYNMQTRERVLVKQDRVEGEFDPEKYETRRFFVKARDGAQVPLTLVYNREISLEQNNPLLLYAYGSYGSSVDPRFSHNLVSLLDRGFIYGIAHVRGGQEMGRQWYEEGKLLKKKNTFNDFIDCAEFLIDKGYTSKSKLFASGGSAGGLLIGAVINQRPDLFNAVIAAVPFVDVVTTMLDESIPLTTAEYDEWGNPENKLYFDYMLSYSPYDNIKKVDYPNVLATSGLHDSQVQYWEPTKWVARLRDHNQADTRILLYTNMEAGHGGASGRFRRLREVAMQYAFILYFLEQK